MASKLLDGVKVVLIERHDDLRSALAEFLSQRGARVIGFPQPSQALEAVEQMQADVLDKPFTPKKILESIQSALHFYGRRTS